MARKSPASKPPATPKPAPARKATTKAKAAPKTTAPKTTPPKSTAKVPSKTAARAKTTDTASKAAALQSDLRKLEGRLKRADTLTRKSVTALETIVETLEARLKSSNATQKAQLTRHVNALGARLDDQLRKTRETVRRELKEALSQGGLDTLEAALASASERVDAAEIAQSDAIARINRHLADMARAVEARIAQEARDRARDIQGVEARLAEARAAVDARIASVERDSADALTRVGDQVARIHDSLQGERQADADLVTEKVNELALQTQAELESHHARLDDRLDAIERRQAELDAMPAAPAADDGRLRQELLAELLQLRTRIEGLERDAAVSALSQAPAPAPHVTPPLPAASAPSAAVASFSDDNPYAAALQTAPAPSQFAHPSDAAQRQPHEPVEFDPAIHAAPVPVTAAEASPTVVAFAQPGTPPAPARVDTPTPPAPPAEPSAFVPERPPMPDFPPVPEMAAAPEPVIPTEADFAPAPMPGIPYANPAYAEDGSPKAVRIAGDGDAGRRLPISGRNLKLGALVVGGSLLAVVTARSLLVGNPAPNPEARLNGPMIDIPSASAPHLDPAPQITGPAPAEAFIGTPPPDVAAPASQGAMVEPIGQYAEAAPVAIASDKMDTLEKAVAAGDPIAQFQMGLARIEQGDAAAGAKLLRAAADADQPAALYRLAKLHEAGQGVEADDATARRLIERAARGGNRIAMHDLALYYTEGRGGLDADIQTARSWFEQAALRGVIDSQFNLALLSESAEGGLVPDREDAVFWYSVAARQGDQFAIDRRDILMPTLDADAAARVESRLAAFRPRPIDEEANGIFGPQPWTRAVARAAGPDETVRTAQALLARIGFDAGPADGLMGSKTRSAIRDFQRANGLEPTGTPDAVLMERLEVAAGV